MAVRGAALQRGSQQSSRARRADAAGPSVPAEKSASAEKRACLCTKLPLTSALRVVGFGHLNPTNSFCLTIRRNCGRIHGASILAAANKLAVHGG
jgi:hypothetical protein